ncbi:nucleolar and spindle-associated protein 1 isoform X1 [Seriola aureovittata]|uniref:nucleolar and spindle-associated protein 1 isoform X1 n=1 Tax=Seriola aureovittata TaxID=2871759 RepID=UPI0024BDB44C|nr:nucleolar and spindle-associated protein 1 isoform X1 [Seriola aureovittata]
MDLDSMKYAELRSLAKELGVKANMKADKLLKMIKQHYQQEKNKAEEQGNNEGETAVQEDENAGRSSDQENKDSTRREEVSRTDVFVNRRRGKGNNIKRKISDTAIEAELPPSAAEGDTEVAASASTRGAKKRKVSSVKDAYDTELPEQQQEADIRDEAPVKGDAEKAGKVAKAGKIPHHQGLQQKRKLLKPVTPNFKKLHEAHFNKMESIDTYVQRKNKQIETFRNSVKEVKMLSDKTKQQQVDGKTQKVNQSRVSMFSPALVNKRQAEDKRRNTLFPASKAPQNKPAAKEDGLFRPSVLSTRRINVRFSEAARDNEYKRSLVKTPARMSSCLSSSTPQTQASDAVKPNHVKTSTVSATKTPGTFVFTGNTSSSTTPGTQKQSFDLKASLSRPLTYKPHKGKLKPFGDANENTATTGNKSLISNSHQKNYKQHQVQTREHRRTRHMEDRKQKKENVLGARRGLVMM